MSRLDFITRGKLLWPICWHHIQAPRLAPSVLTVLALAPSLPSCLPAFAAAVLPVPGTHWQYCETEPASALALRLPRRAAAALPVPGTHWQCCETETASALAPCLPSYMPVRAAAYGL